LGPNKTFVVLIGNADPKFAAVPYALLNMVSKKLSIVMFQALRKKCKLEGTEYEKRIQNNPAVYGEIQRILKEYFSNQDEEKKEEKSK
jgi:hypothetical protein